MATLRADVSCRMFHVKHLPLPSARAHAGFYCHILILLIRFSLSIDFDLFGVL